MAMDKGCEYCGHNGKFERTYIGQRIINLELDIAYVFKRICPQCRHEVVYGVVKEQDGSITGYLILTEFGQSRVIYEGGIDYSIVYTNK